MIEPFSLPHRAKIDDSGNIIVPGSNSLPADEPRVSRNEHHASAASFSEVMREESWEIIDDPETKVVATTAVTTREDLGKISAPIQHILHEGAQQYQASFAQTIPTLEELSRETRSILNTCWKFLKQPVWVLGRKDRVKEYSRGTLFFMDVFRFGGTFAMIFGLLFLTLNYQSFWQIAAAKVSPLIEPQSLDGATSAAVNMPKALEQHPGSILAYLPDVGPPVNMIVIPKLQKIAPLVSPPTESILAQRWDDVEKDIQKALLQGVVHYPGTARPGQAGNFFVTGHSSNYPWIQSAFNTVFARLHEMNVGDEYWVYYNGDKHRYIIRTIKEVSPADTSVLDQPSDERLATLMTCTPTGTTLRRLILVSQEVDPDSGEPLKVGQHRENSPTKLGIETLSI